jgi:hypothetical protein
MKRRFLYGVLLVIMSSVCAHAQLALKYIGLETGATSIAVDAVPQTYIRSSAPPYNDATTAQNISGEMYRAFLGAKVEATFKEKFRFSTGLRFSELVSTVSSTSTAGYFYFLDQQDATVTHYLTVKKLTQKTNYLGIPLEARFFPFDPRKFKIYFMLGGEASYRIATTTTADFNDPAMGAYQKTIGPLVGNPKTLCYSFYGGAGVMIGGEGKPQFSWGLSVPAFISNSSSPLVSPTVGMGVHFQVLVPLKFQK